MKQLTAKHYTSETVLYIYFSQLNHTLEDLKKKKCETFKMVVRKLLIWCVVN